VPHDIDDDYDYDYDYDNDNEGDRYPALDFDNHDLSV